MKRRLVGWTAAGAFVPLVAAIASQAGVQSQVCGDSVGEFLLVATGLVASGILLLVVAVAAIFQPNLRPALPAILVGAVVGCFVGYGLGMVVGEWRAAGADRDSVYCGS